MSLLPPYMGAESSMEHEASYLTSTSRNTPSIIPGMNSQNMDLASFNAVLSVLSLENLGLDMSLEEAVTKLRDLAKENAKLRDDAQKNNQTMKQQYETLCDWKAKWEEERDEVKKKHQQAKTVVNSLKEQVTNKEDAIKNLQFEMAQIKGSTSNSSSSVKAELLEMENSKVKYEKKCAIYMNQIQALMEELQEMKTAKEEQLSEMDKYVRIAHENEQKNSQLQGQTKMLKNDIESLQKLKEENERLKRENGSLLQEEGRLKAELEQASGFVHVGVVETGIEVSDSVPFTGDPSVNKVYSSEYNEQSVSDLLAQLQEERTKVSNLKTECRDKNTEIEAMHRKVHKTEEMLVANEVEHSKEKEEIKIRADRLQQEVDKLRAFPSHSPDKLPSPPEDEMKNLKIQVTSLVCELQQANDKLDSMNNLYEKQKKRIQSLEDAVEKQKDDMEIQRNNDNDLIDTLRKTINSLENQLLSERKDVEETNKAAQKVHQDYGMLVKRYQAVERELESYRSTTVSALQQKQYEERIDHLSTQLFNANELLTERTAKLKDLDQQKNKLQKHFEDVRMEIDMVAVHKAQAEVYKSDFEAEREAREKAHSEIGNLKEEINQLNLCNQQLQEEMDNISQNQIQQMQMRHGSVRRYGSVAYPPTYHNPLASRDSSLLEHGGHVATEQEEQTYECPKCGEQSPDLDTLQLHVLDCVD